MLVQPRQVAVEEDTKPPFVLQKFFAVGIHQFSVPPLHTGGEHAAG